MDGFRFKKRFGQNFLTDKNLLMAIVKDAGIDIEDAVLEIGAGAGAMTVELARTAKYVVAYEIDLELKPVLENRLGDYQNVRLIFADFLRQWKNEELSGFADSYKVVANLPYYITTPVLFRLIEDKKPPLSITVMVQKEVGARLCAKAGTSDYGALTAMTALYGNAKIIRDVRAEMFYPRPNVDSCIVRIDRTDTFLNVDRGMVSKLVSTAFAMRRKTLANNLTAVFSMSKAQAEEVIKTAGLDIRVRGEELDIERFILLADLIKRIIAD